MTRTGRRFRVALCAVIAAFSVGAHAQPELELSMRLRAQLTDPAHERDRAQLQARAALLSVYRSRGFEPLWFDGDGLSAHASAFIGWLDTVPAAHGLRTDDYHLAAAKALASGARSDLLDLELALSDAFLVVGEHFMDGRIDPETLRVRSLTDARNATLESLLAQVARADSAGDLLESLLPDHPAYAVLVAQLARLERVRSEGGWPGVEPGPTLAPGDAGARVAQLSRRLVSSGDLATTAQAFTPDVEAAVRGFQERHGLAADGIVGRATLAALNAPVDARIEQIIVNLERWRWLPQTLGDRYVLVNIAAFRLDAIDEGRPALAMRVVVGLPYRSTPIFSDSIRYLVLNPNWDVPTRIALADKLPLIKSNPGYLEAEGYQLLRGAGANERVIDPLSVDWSEINARNFPFHLRQRPGPFNALGRIKFMFPNRYSVYLHDTPTRSLFAEDTRAFSSGCIRVEAPFDLAELLMRGDPEWSRARLEQTSAEDMQQTVWLPRPMPIHLLYWTAWIDPADGSLRFSDDLYGRDAPLQAALSRPLHS